MAQIEKRLREEMEGKTKASLKQQQRKTTAKLENWGLKRYIKECDSDTIKDIIKIRLHMWEANCNYKNNNTDEICPICK